MFIYAEEAFLKLLVNSLDLLDFLLFLLVVELYFFSWHIVTLRPISDLSPFSRL